MGYLKASNQSQIYGADYVKEALMGQDAFVQSFKKKPLCAKFYIYKPE
jgi:hypothetical protein